MYGSLQSVAQTKAFANSQQRTGHNPSPVNHQLPIIYKVSFFLTGNGFNLMVQNSCYTKGHKIKSNHLVINIIACLK